MQGEGQTLRGGDPAEQCGAEAYSRKHLHLFVLAVAIDAHTARAACRERIIGDEEEEQTYPYPQGMGAP